MIYEIKALFKSTKLGTKTNYWYNCGHRSVDSFSVFNIFDLTTFIKTVLPNSTMPNKTGTKPFCVYQVANERAATIIMKQWALKHTTKISCSLFLKIDF